MQKLLLRRTIRELKANLFRYFALFLLIALSMFMVVGLVGAAESIIYNVNNIDSKNNLEDGEFGVFVPLEKEIVNELEEKGVKLEEVFSQDFTMEDKSVLRLMKNREKINLIELSEGNIAKKDDEITIERIYATAHKYKVGDIIEIGGEKFNITGIVTTPDYNNCLKNSSDTSSDGKFFGTAFVTENGYEKLFANGESDQSEEYIYSYILPKNMNHNELKDFLLEKKLKAEDIQNEYIDEITEEAEKEKSEITNKVQSLVNGIDELKNGMTTLTNENENIQQATNSLTEVLSNIPNGNEYLYGITKYLNGTEEINKGIQKLSDGTKELKDKTDEILEENFSTEIENLTSFVKAEDNPRIKASNDDVEINITLGLVVGVIVLILLTYVISVFVVHTIEKESSIIGALYALGVKRKQLILHYTLLPVIVCLFGGIVGTFIGYSNMSFSIYINDSYRYFSIPEISAIYKTYLLIYGIVIPPLVAMIVNCLIIRSKLNKTALSLLRKETKKLKTNSMIIKGKGFVRTFQIRQFLREKRSCFAILFGMFVSLLILIIGMNTYVVCINMQKENKEDVKYEYMYQYKYPTKTPPNGGSEAYVEGLKKEILGYNTEVNIIGLTKDNSFFPKIKSDSKNEISISTAVASKYGLKVGDELSLNDEINERIYGFKIKEIVPYSVGLCVFMNIDSMRELFEKDEDYYNVIYSDHKLDIDSNRLYNIQTKDDASKSADIFMDMMWSTIIMLIAMSILVFIIVMYQMIKVMIERSSFSISLMKIFGYREKEVRALYLDGNFIIVLIGTIILLPIGKLFIDAIYPFFVANISCGIDMTWKISLYVVVFIGVIVCYLLISAMLMKQLRKLTPADVLKDRE